MDAARLPAVRRAGAPGRIRRCGAARGPPGPAGARRPLSRLSWHSVRAAAVCFSCYDLCHPRRGRRKLLSAFAVGTVQSGATQRVGHGAGGLVGGASTIAAVDPAVATVAAVAAVTTAVGRLALAGPGAGAGFVVQAEGERNPFAGDVGVEHLDPDDVAGLDDLARILDERAGHGRDVHEPVLVHADVDEGAERGDVGDDAFE